MCKFIHNKGYEIRARVVEEKLGAMSHMNCTEERKSKTPASWG